MHEKKRNPKWRLTTESVYIFGREERLQSAYEITLPVEKFELREIEDDKFEIFEDRTICQSVK